MPLLPNVYQELLLAFWKRSNTFSWLKTQHSKNKDHGIRFHLILLQFSSVQSLSRVRLFATPWIAARQASLSITNSRSSLKLISIESVMPSSHLILRRPLLLLPPSVCGSKCQRWLGLLWKTSESPLMVFNLSTQVCDALWLKKKKNLASHSLCLLYRTWAEPWGFCTPAQETNRPAAPLGARSTHASLGRQRKWRQDSSWVIPGPF